MKPYPVHAIRSVRRQGGSILINAAAGLSLGVILLSVVDLGYIFFYKREYQKSADLAALAGAQRLRSGCTAARNAGESSANNNIGARAASKVMTCGTWTPTAVLPATRFTETGTSPDAVRAIISGQPPRFLPLIPASIISASAIATLGDPQASFSVGTKAVAVGPSSDSLLGPILEGLGLDLAGTSLVGYDGLAAVKITPGGLLQELGIPVAADITAGGLNALLAANKVSLGTLLNAIATVAGQSSLASVNLALVNRIRNPINLNLATTDPLIVALGSEGTTKGLFTQIVTPDLETNSALKAQIGVLDLVNAAVGVATSNHAITANVPLNLLGLVSVTAQVGVVEPPSIAIGGLGSDGICNGGEVCPTAYTAQVRTFVHIKTAGTIATLLAPLLVLDLPIVIDAVTGKGTLQEMCTDRLKPDGVDRAEILVNASVGKVCIGKINPIYLFSKSQACDDSLEKMELLNVVGLLKLPDNRINLSALEATPRTHDLYEGQTKTSGNELFIGDTVSSLVSEITTAVLGGTPSGTLASDANNQTLAQQLFDDTSNLCTANTKACHNQRITAAKASLEAKAAQSGLVSGLLTGLDSLVNALLGGLLNGNGCTVGSGFLSLGPISDANCVTVLKDSLNKTSNGGTLSNALAVATGILKPVLNSLGSLVLTPILTDVIGLHLGKTDVKLTSLSCGGNPKLVD